MENHAFASGSVGIGAGQQTHGHSRRPAEYGMPVIGPASGLRDVEQRARPVGPCASGRPWVERHSQRGATGFSANSAATGGRAMMVGAPRGALFVGAINKGLTLSSMDDVIRNSVKGLIDPGAVTVVSRATKPNIPEGDRT